MKHLTIRNIEAELSRALEREVRRRGESLNATVKQLLERALGLSAEGPSDNGLGKLAGGWSEDEFSQFEQSVECFERVDDELWK